MDPQGPPPDGVYGSCGNVTVFLAKSRPTASQGLGRADASIMTEISSEPFQAPAPRPRPTSLNFTQSQPIGPETPASVVAPNVKNTAYQDYKTFLQKFRHANKFLLFWDIIQWINITVFHVWYIMANPTVVFFLVASFMFVFKVCMYIPICFIQCMLERKKRSAVARGAKWIQRTTMVCPLMTIVDIAFATALIISNEAHLVYAFIVDVLLLANASAQLFYRHWYLRHTVAPLVVHVEEKIADINLGRAMDYTTSA